MLADVSCVSRAQDGLGEGPAGYRAGWEPDFALLGSTPMSDPVMPYPWHHPSLRRLRSGDIVLNEISIGHNGCSGQLIIPIALGEPPAEYRELYDVARRTLGGRGGRSQARQLHRRRREGRPACERRGDDPAGPADPRLAEPGGQSILVGLSGRRPLSEEPHYVSYENQLVMVEPNPTTHERKRGVFLGTLYVVTPGGGKNLHSHPLDFAIV